ncbi:hypothetical protein AGMMS49974_06820 [Deltaproteobacteria bacterium]|nr:hypothetical protein AGMMS49925_02710 [Deltaproteobacteria bacterium]GHU95420.1 hypothetical protein AGMMS49974_06820 [Deltaproteobacteria bacterium]
MAFSKSYGISMRQLAEQYDNLLKVMLLSREEAVFEKKKLSLLCIFRKIKSNLHMILRRILLIFLNFLR